MSASGSRVRKFRVASRDSRRVDRVRTPSFRSGLIRDSERSSYSLPRHTSASSASHFARQLRVQVHRLLLDGREHVEQRDVTLQRFRRHANVSTTWQCCTVHGSRERSITQHFRSLTSGHFSLLIIESLNRTARLQVEPDRCEPSGSASKPSQRPPRKTFAVTTT